MKANNVLHRDTRERHIVVASLRLIFSLFMTLIALAVDLMATMVSSYCEAEAKTNTPDDTYGFENGWKWGHQGYGFYVAGDLIDDDD